MLLKIIYTLYYIIFSILILGCGNDSSIDSNENSELENIGLSGYYSYSFGATNATETIETTPSSCSQEDQNRVVYNHMKESYLWYDHLPDVDYLDYNSTKNLLEDLKYKKYDKWSHIISLDQYNDYYNKGIYAGFGFSFDHYNNKIFVNFVYKNSPAYKAGFRRSTEILEINKMRVNDMTKEQFFQQLSGDRKVGEEVLFMISNGDAPKVVTLKKEIIETKSVFNDKIIDLNGKKIGYFVLNSFIEPTRFELETLFDRFKKEEIEDLILDMRYNGGGRVSVANYLASLIGGESMEGDLFEKLEFNDKQSKFNSSIFFTKEKNQLNLDRVFIISTSRTCSASEMIINGLKPYMDLFLIGSNTCGKPVGMQGIDFCGNHLSSIEFKMVNENGDGDYFSGITPRCNISDDVFHPLGDLDEKMLNETLFFIENSVCSTVEKRYQIEEKQSNDNAFLFKEFWTKVDAI